MPFNNLQVQNAQEEKGCIYHIVPVYWHLEKMVLFLFHNVLQKEAFSLRRFHKNLKGALIHGFFAIWAGEVVEHARKNHIAAIAWCWGEGRLVKISYH